MSKASKSNTTRALQGAQLPGGTVKRSAPARDAQTSAPAPGAKQDQSNPQEVVSERSPAPEEQEITLKFSSPQAREVKVAGTFNGWRPDATPLKNTASGEWAVRLSLRSGQYEYRFVVDGRWCEDPQAPRRGKNPYGGFNSILSVPLAD